VYSPTSHSEPKSYELDEVGTTTF